SGTTRRWRGGSVTSSPGSSGRRGSGRRTWRSWTSPASSSPRPSAAPWPRGARGRCSTPGTGGGRGRRAVWRTPGPRAGAAGARGPGVGGLLGEVDRGLGGVTVVWDRNQIHSRARAVRAWLAEHPGVVVEDFPGYVPDLNPDEGVWGWTKYGRLANLAAHDK